MKIFQRNTITSIPQATLPILKYFYKLYIIKLLLIQSLKSSKITLLLNF